ncbi:MAG: invasion associated locus B family protein [Planctomycetes bacterium]|nr:invasion associated locus B family protein [Planctomycetota bacterium]
MLMTSIAKMGMLASITVALTAASPSFAQTANKKGDAVSAKQSRQAVGDWIVACAQAAAGKKKSCAVTQSLRQAKTSRLLGSVSVGTNAEGKNFANVSVPMGVLLTEPANLKINDGKPLSAPFRTCSNNGCVAVFELSDKQLASLRDAKSFSVEVKTVNEKTLRLAFSVNGLTKAYEMMAKELSS